MPGNVRARAIPLGKGDTRGETGQNTPHFHEAGKELTLNRVDPDEQGNLGGTDETFPRS